MHYVGPDNHIYVFIACNFLYTLLTILPVYFFYKNFYVHTSFIILIVMMSIFNGADYYIEVFSRRYRAEIEKLIEPSEDNNGTVSKKKE